MSTNPKPKRTTHDLEFKKQAVHLLNTGADLAVANGVAIGARGIVGISYIFGRPVVPLDVYVQFSPAFWFGSGGASGIQFYFSGGSRYYF